MNRTVIAALSIGILAGAGAGYWFAGRTPAPRPEPSAAAPATAPQGERRILYWYDPMVPQSRFDKPGKSPFMDMQLVPRYADETADEGSVAVSARVVQSLGVRTAEARLGSLAPRVGAVGSVEYNERSVVLVQPRASGFIEKLHVRAPLDPVRAGDPLVEILFPDWAGAQEEYLLLRQRSEPSSRELAAAARQRLTLLGMSDEQIAAVEREGKARPRVTLRAPVSGVVAELGAREGMTVTAGATLFRIAGLGSVWVVAQVPEAQAGLLVPGSRVEVGVPAYPGETFPGRVSAILPEVNAATRTLRARIEVANPGGKLKPGMYANLALSARGREGLLVPAEAVIRTGERNVVILVEGEGKFRAVDVEVGMEAGSSAEIRKGLKAGDRVVVSGQFLIDSEASLRSTLARLPGAGETVPETHAEHALHRGRGQVSGVEAARGTVSIEHEPILSLKWPAMTMPFSVADRKQLAGIKPGDIVEFEIRAQPNPDGLYVIEKLTGAGKVAGGRKP
jgi:Cu(I)/Ag(I) efflux system membrane fusion protein